MDDYRDKPRSESSLLAELRQRALDKGCQRVTPYLVAKEAGMAGYSLPCPYKARWAMSSWCRGIEFGRELRRRSADDTTTVFPSK